MPWRATWGCRWRAELAASIFMHRDKIDLKALIADDHLHASKRQLRALRTLAGQVPMLHEVTQGLASIARPRPWWRGVMKRLLRT